MSLRLPSHFEKCVDAEITINRARDSYYDKQLSSCKGDSKGTYKVINKLLDKEYGSNKLPNGEDIEVADKLKTFFDKKVKTIYSNFFFFFFLKRGWAWLAHERIAYECFAYLWGTAVLWEDASGIKMCNQG